MAQPTEPQGAPEPGKGSRLTAPIVGLVLAVMLGLSAYLIWMAFSPNGGGFSGSVTSRQIGPAIGGAFTLVDQDGRTVTQADFLGKPTAIFFGYTHCPDACPTTLTDMTDRLKALGRDGDKFNVLFISIDPERDTPALLKTYLESFDPRIKAATGTREQVEDVMKKFRVYWRKVGEGDSYTYDHSAAVYMMNARGELVTLIEYQAKPDEAVEKMRRALAS
jgi:protein SCO1/2